MSLAEDPYLEPQAFPVLTEAQIALLLPFSEIRPTRADDVVFEVGDGGYHLVVVPAGRT